MNNDEGASTSTIQPAASTPETENEKMDTSSPPEASPWPDEATREYYTVYFYI